MQVNDFAGRMSLFSRLNMDDKLTTVLESWDDWGLRETCTVETPEVNACMGAKRATRHGESAGVRVDDQMGIASIPGRYSSKRRTTSVALLCSTFSGAFADADAAASILISRVVSSDHQPSDSTSKTDAATFVAVTLEPQQQAHAISYFTCIASDQCIDYDQSWCCTVRIDRTRTKVRIILGQSV
nr:hypothetical protein CFP56_52401 [Quercus suber]